MTVKILELVIIIKQPKAESIELPRESATHNATNHIGP